MSLLRAEYLRVCRKCDLNPPGFRRDLLRALAIIRPGNRYEAVA